MEGFKGSLILKYDIVNVQLNHNGFRIGAEYKNGASIGIEGQECISWDAETGYFKPYICFDGNMNRMPNDIQPYDSFGQNFPLASFGGYFIVGASFDWGFDQDYFIENYWRIWYG